MGGQGAVGLHPQEKPIGGRDDQQAAIGLGEEVDAHRKGRHAGDDLALTLEIECDDLVRAPVRDPDAAIVPAWRLGEREAAHQDLNVRHGGSFPNRVVW
jgi:hypothetical protein